MERLKLWKSISVIIVIAMVTSLLIISPVNKNQIVDADSESADTARVDTFDELKTAVNDPEISTVVVGKNIEFKEALTIQRNLVIKGSDNPTLSMPEKCGFLHFIVEDDLEFTVKDITVRGPGRNLGKPGEHNGGIMSNDRCKLYFENVTLSDCHNARGSQGHAWANDGSAITRNGRDSEQIFMNCIISDNTSDLRGGAINCDGLKMENCIIRNNVSYSGGGAIFCGATSNRKDRYLKNCIAYNNESISGNGGVIDVIGIGIYNCTMYDNKAARTSGVFYFGGDCVVVNSTIVNNKCGLYAGAITNVREIINSTVSGNECGDQYKSGGVNLSENNQTIIKGSIISGNYSGKKNEPADIAMFKNDEYEYTDEEKAYNIIGHKGKISDLLLTKTLSGREYPLLADNGGFTPTVLPAPNSPAMNAIPKSEYYSWFEDGEALTTDQRGMPRPDAGNPGYVDVGAIDVLVFAPVKVTFLSNEPSKIKIGNTANLSVKYSPSNTTYPFTVWSSSNSKVISVDQNGKATALKEGKAVITAQNRIYKNISVKREITVMKPVSKIASPLKTLYLKKKTQYSPAVVMYNGKTVIAAMINWKSSNKKIVKINSKGKMTAVKPGKAKITGTTYSGKKIVFKIRVVSNKTELKNIKVSGVKSKLKKGKNAQLKVKLNPSKATNIKVSFKSNKKNVLSVDKNGKLTAKKKGKAKITIKAGNKRKVISVKVV